jgi:ATP-dependent Clp protease adaptor protein ClpS
VAAVISGRDVTVAPDRIDRPEVGETFEVDRGWQVVVWNDPVNLMSYVVFVFRRLFGHSLEEATRLMLAVHHEGRAVVAHGPLEKAEADCHRLHHHGLWATLERL